MKLKDALVLAAKKYHYSQEYHYFNIAWNLPPGLATRNRTYRKKMREQADQDTPQE